jgi:tRNA G46 methylase TrmB
MYGSILKPGGLLRLKTDDDGLFEYSLEQVAMFNNRENRQDPEMNSG